MARLLIDVTQQVRLVARQTLRVAAQAVGDYSSADLPDEPAASVTACLRASAQ